MDVAEAAINYLIRLGHGKSYSPALTLRAYSPFLNLETSVQSCA